MKIKYLVLALLIINSGGIINGEIVDKETITNNPIAWVDDISQIITMDEDTVMVGYSEEGSNIECRVGNIINDNITWYTSFIAGYHTGLDPKMEIVKINNNQFLLMANVIHNSVRVFNGTIGTINNNNITFSHNHTISPFMNVEFISISMLTNSKFIITLQDTTSNCGYAIIGDIISNNIVYGSHYLIDGNMNYLSVNTIDSTHFILHYTDIDNSSVGTSIIGTVTGNNIIFGNEYIFNNDITTEITSEIVNNNKYIISYISNTKINTVIETVTGLNINYGNSYNLNVVGTFPVIKLLNNSDFALIYVLSGNLIYTHGNIDNTNIYYNNNTTIDTSMYYIRYPEICILTSYSYINIYTLWGANRKIYSLLWDNTPDIIIISSNTTSTNHTETFDDLFSDLSVWGFLIVIFTTFENECGNDLFWLIIIMIPVTMMWIKQRSVIIPSILALLCGSVLFSMVPESAIAPIKILLTIGIAGIFYHIIKSR